MRAAYLRVMRLYTNATNATLTITMTAARNPGDMTSLLHATQRLFLKKYLSSQDAHSTPVDPSTHRYAVLGVMLAVEPAAVALFARQDEFGCDVKHLKILVSSENSPASFDQKPLRGSMTPLVHSTPRLGHALQSTFPPVFVNLPNGHCTHVLAPSVFDANPRGHCSHADDPNSATYPVGQFVQFPPNSNFPTEQGSHAD